MGPEVIPGIYLPYTRSNTRQKLALVLIPVPDWDERSLFKRYPLPILARYGSQKKNPHNRTSLVPIPFSNCEIGGMVIFYKRN